MQGLFSFKGRFNRAKWWWIGIGLGVAETIACGVIFALFGVPQTDDAGNITSVTPMTGVLVLLVLIVVS